MEKILRWWTQFLVQLEAGKRVIAIFIVITSILTYSLINANNKLDRARKEAVAREERHGEEIARIKDSSAAALERVTVYYNDKTENIYKQQLDALNQIEKGYKLIKKKNDKIVSSIK